MYKLCWQHFYCRMKWMNYLLLKLSSSASRSNTPLIHCKSILFSLRNQKLTRRGLPKLQSHNPREPMPVAASTFLVSPACLTKLLPSTHWEISLSIWQAVCLGCRLSSSDDAHRLCYIHCQPYTYQLPWKWLPDTLPDCLFTLVE